MRDKSKIQSRLVEVSGLGICLLLVLTFVTISNAQKQTSPLKFAKGTPEQQILYHEYRGVTIGMTAAEARSKLGEPVQKGDDQDFYVFSQTETAQIAYNAAHKVIIISTDYVGGVGAPDYKTVVSGELEKTANGSLYKIMHYDGAGFWVSYNKSTGNVPIVTITIQAELR